LGDGVGEGVEGARGGFSQDGFELGEHLLDRAEVRRVFGREDEAGAGGADRLSRRLCFVRAQIVEDDDVARLERGDEELFDIGEEALAVDGAVEQARRVDAVVAQGGEEGRGLPATVREPLRSKRSTHLIAEDSLTPNRSAAALRLIPPTITASITRSRKYCE